MSSQNGSFHSLNDFGKTIANLLFINLANDSQLKSIFKIDESIENQISLASPEELKTKGSAKLSICLYNVTEFSAMKNTPPNPPNQNPPIYLTLHYLFTPFTNDQNNDQLILGKIIQTFLDNPVLRGSLLQGTLADNSDDIRVTLDLLSIDDLNKLWTMFSMPFKLCLSYSVSPILIQPSRQPESKPVIQKSTTYKQEKPGESP